MYTVEYHVEFISFPFLHDSITVLQLFKCALYFITNVSSTGETRPLLQFV